MKIQWNPLSIAGIVACMVFCPKQAGAEFKVDSAYGDVIDHGDFLTYKWHIQVAQDSTEPMYAVHFTTESLHQLGYYNFQSSRGWAVGEAIHEYTGNYLSIWFECTYTNRIFPGESIDLSADISKRFVENEIGPGVMVMTGTPLAEDGEGIISGQYVPLARVNASTNGMLKSWANQYGLVPPASRMESYNAAETEDPDGDGDSNLFEFIADTDPANALSYMQMIVTPLRKGETTISVYPLSDRAIYDIYGAKNDQLPMEYIGSFTAQEGGLELRGKYRKWTFGLEARMLD